MNGDHNILIIDDDQADRECYRRYLPCSYNIVEAETGQGGIDLCSQDTIPDCILLDYILPDLNGLEVLSKISKEVKNTFSQIIFLTGHGNEDTAVKALTHGAHDYLVKTSLNKQTLQDTVSNALKKRKNLLTKFQEEQEIFQKAFYDNLTGLYNKYAFYRSIEKLLESAKRHKRIFALLFIDLNKFKIINDTYNHHVGDLLLQQVANRIKSRMRKEDIVARISGDEFAIALPEIQDHHNAGTIAQRLLDEISQQCIVDGHRINITASIGISLYPSEDGQTVQELINNADNAMYIAKKEKLSSCHYSINKFNTEFYGYNDLNYLISKELQAKHFTVDYTPFYDIQNNSIFGHMPSIKWSNDMLNNSELCDLYESLKKIGLLSNAMYEIFYAYFNCYKKPEKNIIIKINKHEFLDRGFISNLMKALEKSKLEVRNVYLEINSIIIFDNGDTGYTIINSLLEQNINLILSLSGIDNKIMHFIQRFNKIKTLKISKKILLNQDIKCNDIVVRSISAIAQSLDVQIIFTEINDEETANYAASINAQIGQGSYLDKKYGAS